MLGGHHQLNGHEFQQTPGDGEGQGSLACCSQWGCKQLGMTWQLNNKRKSARQRENAISMAIKLLLNHS